MSENSNSDSDAATIQAGNVNKEATAVATASCQPSLDAEPFYFETDCAALRNNADYSCLLKTLVLLEAQRVQACHDLECLIDLREHALKANPREFVKKELPAMSHLLPYRQKVYCLPQIDWNKYFEAALGGAGGIDTETLEAIKQQNISRSRRANATPKYTIKSKRVSRQGEQETGQDSPSSSKKPNFNKGWSVEEQRRLEELLIEIPPEDNEASRWRKIAAKLGNRTPLQVQSHCQKYFIKLAKAGLPIPGRMPNLRVYKTRKSSRGRASTSINPIIELHGRRLVGRGSSLNQISSMWTSFNPPIKMSDDNEPISAKDFEFMNDDEDDDDDDDNDNHSNGDEDDDDDDEMEEEEDEDEEDNLEQFQDYENEEKTTESNRPPNVKQEPIDNDEEYSNMPNTSSKA